MSNVNLLKYAKEIVWGGSPLMEVLVYSGKWDIVSWAHFKTYTTTTTRIVLLGSRIKTTISFYTLPRAHTNAGAAPSAEAGFDDVIL
jgi:hypothetical protein